MGVIWYNQWQNRYHEENIMNLTFSVETGTIESNRASVDGLGQNTLIIRDRKLSTLHRFAYPLAGCSLETGDEVKCLIVKGVDNNNAEVSTRVFGIAGTRCNTCPLVNACFHNYAIETYKLGISRGWTDPEVVMRNINLRRLMDNF